MSEGPPTARELQQRTLRSEQPALQVSGKPADRCPYCNCAMFIDGVNRTDREILRYVECRNPNCGKRFKSIQPPARLLSEITKDDDNSAGGKDVLTMPRQSA